MRYSDLKTSTDAGVSSSGGGKHRADFQAHIDGFATYEDAKRAAEWMLEMFNESLWCEDL